MNSLYLRRRRLHTGGFSLIELLVSIAILAIITSTILARYTAFNSTVLLKDLAYEVALSLREAQSYGVSVQGDGGQFDRNYGMHFTVGNTYSFFVDRNANLQYDAGEAISTFTIGNNNFIKGLYVDGSTTSLASMDVMFQRPEPDAILFAGSVLTTYASATIVVGSPNGAIRTVRVYPTGQLSIE